MATFWYVTIGLDRLRSCLKFQAFNSSQALSRDSFRSDLVQKWAKMAISAPQIANNSLLKVF